MEKTTQDGVQFDPALQAPTPRESPLASPTSLGTLPTANTYTSPMLSRHEVDHMKQRAEVLDGSMEARMFALENKVADSHKQISNQIAELARMLEHVYFGPPQTNLNYKKTS